jgi:putative endonuclease
MAESHNLGRLGEELAAAMLRERGWKILERHFRLGHKEIDLVARRGQLVVFVEVKTRGSLRYGHPLEAITRAKRAEIALVASAWIARHGRHGDSYRFDAVSILSQGCAAPEIEHIEDAWRI